MISGIIIGIVIGISIIFVVFFFLAINKREKNKKKKVKLDTYAKVATTAVLVHGMILTSLSYLLASAGLDPVVDVSSTIVREIVAPLVVYLGTNMIMNIFEKNKLSFSVPLDSTIITKEKTNREKEEQEET